MNFIPFRKARAVVTPPPRPTPAHAARPHAVWTRDPRTGRLVQAWQGDDDPERSCTGRPCGPLRPQTRHGLRRPRAA